MSVITVIAYYDQNLVFYPTGKTVTIDVDSEICAGYKWLPNQYNIPGTTSYPSLHPYLQIKPKSIGSIYLDMTLASYNALIQAASGSVSPRVISKSYTIGAGQIGQNFITDVALTNVNIIAAFLNGSEIPLMTISYAGDTVTFSTLTFGLDDEVDIIYSNN